ncbi:MAG TPA: hypothetical protein VE999_11510 [Gemmataceae bacterium]|nr:hypothetical protein [Gemmataceae bacterium]
MTQTLRQRTAAQAHEQGIPLLPLDSPAIDKEATALQLASRACSVSKQPQGRGCWRCCVRMG